MLNNATLKNRRRKKRLSAGPFPIVGVGAGCSDWRQGYNQERSHSRLGWSTPAELDQTHTPGRSLLPHNLSNYAPAPLLKPPT